MKKFIITILIILAMKFVKDLILMNLNSLNACFLSPEEKEPIRQELLKYLEK